MLELEYLMLIGILQGVTEFLPVSSSAHLILLPLWLGNVDQGLSYDIAAHLGSLIALISYFRHDLRAITLAAGQSISQRKIVNHDARLFWYLLIATVPVALVGFLARDLIAVYLRSPIIIGSASICFGVLLGYADYHSQKVRLLAQLSVRDVLYIGIMQVLAIIPGTSRSGITLTAGLLLNLDKVAAARFSFLLAIPVIGLASAYEIWKLLTQPAQIDFIGLIVVMVCAAVSAWLTIHYFIKLIMHFGLWPFVVYRIMLGLALILIF